MSQENVDALMRALATCAELQRVEALLDLLDQDIVWDPGDEWPGGRYRGHAGVRSFFRQWIGAFEDFGFEVQECIDAGDAVYVHMHQWGRGKGSGVSTQIDLWQVWLFFEGKVVRYAQKPDRQQALEAVGLSE